MDERDQRYLEALTLAHALSPANSQEEDLLVEALNAAQGRLDLSDDVIDRFQKAACGLVRS